MSMAEFRMETNLAEVTPKSLDFNFEELKAFLTENLKVYKGLVVTEDLIKDASEVKARINKVASAIKEHRIAIKKEYEAPYLAFKEQCDELENMCKEVTDAIGKQLDMYEQKRKDEKKNLLETYFKENTTEECVGFVSFNDVFDTRWLNKTFAIEEAKEAIDKYIDDTGKAISAIRNLNSEFTTTLLDYYKNTHDLMGCINKNKELTELKQEEERKKAEKEKAMQMPPQEPTPMPTPTPTNAEVEKVTEAQEKPSEKLYTVAFKVQGTKTQLEKLKQFLTENGMRYGQA